MKKLIITSLLVLSSTVTMAGMSNGEAAVLGIVIGSQLHRHYQVEQPVVIQQPRYQQWPNEVYTYPQPRQIRPDSAEYCQNMSSTVDAAYCRGVQQRNREILRSQEKDAYNRGYNGN